MQKSDCIIGVEHVSKFFGDKAVLNDVNLSVRKGEFVTILGPSGCGKTTLLRLIAGFQTASEGVITIAGKDITQTPPHRRPVNTVFQKYALFPHLNVFNNIAFGLKLKKLPAATIEKKVKQALRMVGMTDYEDRDVDSLSGGQQQRVALARALVSDPSVMLLDEPLSNLDANLREEMSFEIKDLQRKYGFSIIYVTHDQSEAMALSDRILVMKLGVMQQIDTPLNVYNNPSNKFVFSFIGVSSFTDVTWQGNQAFIKGSQHALPSALIIPNRMRGETVFNLASRPTEIRFTSETDPNGVRGTVIRKAFLGEIIDYLVKIGDQEIRVQIGRRDPGPEVNEVCYLHFLRPFWYKVNE